MRLIFKAIGILLAGCGIEWLVYNFTNPFGGGGFVGVNIAILPAALLICLGGYCFIDLGD